MTVSKPLFIHRWATPLIEGRLIRRYERFVAEVRVGPDVVKAHCVNPGRMEGLVIEGARVWLSTSTNASRAMPYTWELVELDGRLVGTNTALPNALVRAVLEQRLLSGFDDVTSLVPEQVFQKKHRVDFRLQQGEQTHWLEVKNCHLVYPDGYGYFPDSSSERAVAHALALARQVKRGDRATVLFTVQRDDAKSVRPSALHCHEFAVALRKAAKAGVAVRAVRLVPTVQGVVFDGEIEVDLSVYRAEDLRAWCSSYDSTSGWIRKNGNWSGRSVA
jgi:sugar fermentation stimulation protein A